MEKLNFVAIDFETPTQKHNSICQIGIAVVENGEIKENKSFLVKPPYNQYDDRNMKHHFIRPFDTIDKPTLKELWPTVSSYFEDRTLVAHNATFDYSVLIKAANFENINTSKISKPICTCDLHNRAGLADCCQEYNIDLSKHHDAACDAKACAEIYIKYITEGKKEVTKTPKSKQQTKFDSKQTDSYLLQQNKQDADPTNPFYDKKIVYTGDFNSISRQNLAVRLYKMGADIDKSISKKTNIILIGDNPGPKKIEKINTLIESGVNIKLIYENELLTILSEFPVNDVSGHTLTGKRIYFSGESISKADTNKRLKSIGAIIETTPTKFSNVFVIGDNQTDEEVLRIDTLLHDGFNIPKITEAELDFIISNDKNEREFLDVKKDVNITYDFIFNSSVKKIMPVQREEFTHYLGQKNIFIYKPIGDKNSLFQCLGNLGAVPVEYFDPNDIHYCWLTESTINKLRNGIKDDFIMHISNIYNSSACDKFTYKFILESEVLNFLEYRAKESNDDILIELYEKYSESAYKELELIDKNIYNQNGDELLEECIINGVKFKEGCNFTKEKGKTILRTSAKRTWVPSRQLRDS